LFKQYYYLTKPGIVRGNAIAALAGFFLASKGRIDWLLLLAMLVGICLVVASACVFNNYIDRDIDSKMSRTKKRALVSGKITPLNALIYGSVLGVVGLGLLAFYTNILTAFLALLGFFFYVVVYGYFKRHTVYGTVIGSISGAVPPTVGYCAVTNNFDLGALLLFGILVFWQMPHFYSIAIFRMKDYSSASIPVLPIVSGMRAAKTQSLLYIVGYIIVSAAMTLYGYTGITYLVIVTALGLGWLAIGIKDFNSPDDVRWGHKMFGISLLVLLAQCVLLSVDAWLP